MARPPSWLTFVIVAAPALGAFVECRAPPKLKIVAQPISINTTQKSDPATVLRAKLQRCNVSGDCVLHAQVTPRCAVASENYAVCDSNDAGGQPSPNDGYSGYCYFMIPNANTNPSSGTSCGCFEGDTRLCDLNGWKSCLPTNMAGCGLQICEMGPLGDAGPVVPTGTTVPEWGPCLAPNAFFAADAGTGSDAGSTVGVINAVPAKAGVKKK